MYVLTKFFELFQLENQAADHKKYLEDIDKTHEMLKHENELLKQKLNETDIALKESTKKNDQHEKVKKLEVELQSVQQSNTQKEEQIQTMKEKIEYLQEVLTKVERKK